VRTEATPVLFRVGDLFGPNSENKPGGSAGHNIIEITKKALELGFEYFSQEALNGIRETLKEAMKGDVDKDVYIGMKPKRLINY